MVKRGRRLEYFTIIHNILAKYYLEPTLTWDSSSSHWGINIREHQGLFWCGRLLGNDGNAGAEFVGSSRRDDVIFLKVAKDFDQIAH